MAKVFNGLLARFDESRDSHKQAENIVENTKIGMNFFSNKLGYLQNNSKITSYAPARTYLAGLFLGKIRFKK